MQAVLEATQTEQQLIELLAHLPQAVRITQQGSVYLWECPADQGSALTLLEATKQALTTLLGTAPSPETDPSVSLASTQEQAYSTESKHTA